MADTKRIEKAIHLMAKGNTHVSSAFVLAGATFVGIEALINRGWVEKKPFGKNSSYEWVGPHESELSQKEIEQAALEINAIKNIRFRLRWRKKNPLHLKPLNIESHEKKSAKIGAISDRIALIQHLREMIDRKLVIKNASELHWIGPDYLESYYQSEEIQRCIQLIGKKIYSHPRRSSAPRAVLFPMIVDISTEAESRLVETRLQILAEHANS